MSSAGRPVGSPAAVILAWQWVSLSLFFLLFEGGMDACTVVTLKYKYLVGRAASPCVSPHHTTRPPPLLARTGRNVCPFRVVPGHDWLANHQIGSADGESLFPYSDLHIPSAHSDSTIPGAFFVPLPPKGLKASSSEPHAYRHLWNHTPTAPGRNDDACRKKVHARTWPRFLG